MSRLTELILISTASVLNACAAPSSPGPMASHVSTGGLVFHIESAGDGEPSGPESTLLVEIVVVGSTTGPIERLSHKSRTLRLDDPNLIEGLRLALPGIREGEVRRVEIPSHLAYGETGRPPIPPHEDLSCTVRCVQIVAKGHGR